MFRRLLLLLLALVLLAAGAAYAFLPSDQMRTTLERQASAALGLPVRIASARAALFPRLGVTLSDVQIGTPAFLTLARVSLSSELIPLLSRRIEGAEVRVSDTLLSLPLPASLPFLRTGNDAAGAGRSPQGAVGVALVSIHTFALDRVRIRSLGRTVEISAVAGLDGNQLALTQFAASAGRTSLSAKGQVTLGDTVSATLDASASQLDLDDLVALVHAFGLDGGSGSGGSTPSGTLSLRLAAPVVRVAGLEASALSAHVHTSGSQLVIDPLSMTLFDGRVKGSMKLAVKSRVSGQVRMTVSGLDTAKLAAWGNARNTLSGRMAGSGSFSGTGTDLATLLATARGSGTVEIVDGALPGLEFPREALLTLGRPADQVPPANGGRFDRIAAPFAIGGGLLSSEALTLVSRDVNVAASGSLDLASSALALKGTATLSEAMTAMAGAGLTRAAGGGSQIALPATVTGTLGAPKIRLDAGALLKRTLTNEVKRGVLDKLTPLRDLTRPNANRTF